VIVEVVTQDAQGQTKTYTAQQIQDLINQDYAHNFKFKSNNLTVQVTGTSITISGNASVQYWQAFNWDKVAADNAWNNVNHWYSDPAYSIYGDDTEVTVSNLILKIKRLVLVSPPIVLHRWFMPRQRQWKTVKVFQIKRL